MTWSRSDTTEVQLFDQLPAVVDFDRQTKNSIHASHSNDGGARSGKNRPEVRGCGRDRGRFPGFRAWVNALVVSLQRGSAFLEFAAEFSVVLAGVRL